MLLKTWNQWTWVVCARWNPNLNFGTSFGKHNTACWFSIRNMNRDTQQLSGQFLGFIKNSVLKKFKSWFWYINIFLNFFWKKRKRKTAIRPTTSSLIVLFLETISSLRFWKKPGSMVLWFCWNRWFFISSNNNTTLVDALPDAIPLKAGSAKPIVHFRI